MAQTASDDQTLTNGVPTPDHPPGYRLRRGRNWVFLGLTYASYYLCRYNLSPVAPELKHDLGFNNSQYGMINSGRDGAYAVGQMINGLFTDRVGGKQAMTIGAIATIILNLLFGAATWSSAGLSMMVFTLVAIRSIDGYMQAFGAPGMVKINAAWFRRRERGAFAGIFGFMINIGTWGAGQLGKSLILGLSIPLLFTTIHFRALNWRYIFIIPPFIVAVIIILMNLLVKNTPEEAGFHIKHDEEPTGETDEHIGLMDVFRKIASNRTVWIVAFAYFCTGFVRRGVETWWAVYLDDTWNAGKGSGLYTAFVWGLPITASFGSLLSGYISDKLFNSRRAPVAAIMYIIQAGLTLIALLIPHHGDTTRAAVAVCLVIGISMMCNSTHSILGTAAPMDLGGRKMTGCSFGIIDSFQYYGALLSGYGLGALFDYLGGASKAAGHGHLSPYAWFGSMLPFGLLGAGLMTYLWIRHGKSGVAGT
ncbi:MAG TPA: MFS transporter [Phycisphaerae bacterium]|nr:MFS transporter [Phycisphaerae bacterium]